MSASPLAPYASPEQRRARFARAVDRLHGESFDYGHSVGGEPLQAARIPGARPGLPRVLCTANLHGLEFIGGLVVLGLLDRLAPEAELLQRCELWVIPCSNPDGYRRTWDAQGSGRVGQLRVNDHGVDLNRNFPRPFDAPPSRLPFAGSSKPGAATYRGPSPLSEPETRDLDALLRTHDFHAAANLHSFMGTVIPASVRDAEGFAAYRQLAAAFAAGQTHCRYRRIASRRFDTWTGEQEDHQHHHHRTWAICVESFSLRASFRQHLRAPSSFWRFNPRDPEPWVRNDTGGLLAYFAAALDRARPPTPAGC